MPKLHRPTLKEPNARSRKTKWCSGAKQVANWQRSSCKPIIKKSKIHGIGPKAAASPIEVLSFTHLPRTPSILPSLPDATTAWTRCSSISAVTRPQHEPATLHTMPAWAPPEVQSTTGCAGYRKNLCIWRYIPVPKQYAGALQTYL